MASLGRMWAGRAYGTNTGNLAIAFDKDGPELEGVIRFHDDAYGPVVYQVRGEYGDEITLVGTTNQEVDGVAYGQLTIKAALTPEGSLKGEWSSTLGTGGPFIAHPHGDTKTVNKAKAELEVEQFYTQSYEVGALNLTKDDVLSLMEVVARDFGTGRLIVTYRNGGAEITKFGPAFIESIGTLDKLNYLKLFIQEPDEFDVNKIAMVELIDQGVNRIVVQGVREIWVEGKAQTLRSELLKRKRSLVTNFKRFGLNLNQVALFAMIIFMVDIDSVWKRVVFGGAVLGLLKFVEWLHVAFIPNASIRLGSNADTWFTRWWPSIFSWVSGVTTTVAGGYIVYILTGSGS